MLIELVMVSILCNYCSMFNLTFVSCSLLSAIGANAVNQILTDGF